MKINDLQIGDVLVDNAHTGIFLGIIDDKPIIANALSGGFHGANLRCTSPDSFLKACNTSHPILFRCLNQKLAKKAAAIALKHSENRDIIYDFKRLRVAQDFSSIRDAQLVPKERSMKLLRLRGF